MARFQGLYSLPPGVHFARAFVEGLMDRMRDEPPQAMARVTIYANAARTITALAHAFDEHGPMLLPRLLPVTDLGVARIPGIPARGAGDPVMLSDPLARRLQLARLVQMLLDRRPDLAAGHSVPALARSLATLMTEMQTEGLEPEALEAIDAGDHARHWDAALSFLRIAARFHLTGPVQDRPARQRAAAQAAVSDWAQGLNLPPGPVIVAGSTGSHGATRLFMQAVARLPHGAVVLPGFDTDQPAPVWDGLDAGTEDHPQARFAPLIRDLGPPRPWTGIAAPCPARAALVSLALRPAPVTDQWIAEGPALPPLAEAAAQMTLIEADQPGDESDTIALILRDAVERGTCTTLISADQGLIRRVTAALDRWHLRPDNSAGVRLDLTAPGLLLRQVAGLFGQALTIDRLLILLKHPLTATGSAAFARNDFLRITRDLELRLRARGPAFPDGDSLRAWGDRGDALRRRWCDWLAGLLDRITPLATDNAPRPLPDRVADLVGLAQDLAAGPGGDPAASQLWAARAGQMALAVMQHLGRHADQGPAMGPGDLCVLLSDEMRAVALRDDAQVHPLILIRGPREARISAHGRVILAGLNEGGWPQSLDPDPWLSRQMRAAAGLPLPERQIGLAAHDFQQAVNASEVVLTRARRNAEAETIPSRWLNRMLNLMAGLPEQGGPQALDGMRARGAEWLAAAQALRRPQAALPPAPRPAPIPPAPPFAELPVTDVAHLIRDPYAIYAKRVLGLRPLNPLRPRADAALRGQTLHSIVEALLHTRPDPDTPAEVLEARFLAITDAVLARDVPWPTARAFWRARMAGIARQIVVDELARLREGHPQVIERRGAVALAGRGFRLTAKPDRIDLLHDGRVQIYDYKSGAPPSDRQIAAFDKQLMLEAAMARRGGFDALGPVDVAGIAYIQLGGDGLTHPRAHDAGTEARTWDGFVRLIASYLTGGTGFTAIRAPELTAYKGDYDHLARFGEWALSDPARPEKVGDHG